MTGQAEGQPNTVEDAASLIEGSGVLDALDAEPKDEAPEAPPEEEGDEEASETDDEAEEEEGAEPEADADESEEDGDKEPDDDPEEEETAELETIADLAEALETSVDDLQDSLKVTVVVDGKPEPVTLKEAIAGYQKDADYRKKTSELAEQRRDFEAERQAKNQFVEQQHQVAAQILQAQEQTLVREMQQLDQSELRNTDPAEWAARRAELQDRARQFESTKQHAATAYQQHQAQAQAEQQKEMAARLQEEANLLLAAEPDFQSHKAGLETYLRDSFGFSDTDMANVADHRLIRMALKAMKYDQQAQKATVAKKKIKKIPKTQKAAPPAKPVNAAKANLTKAKQRLKKTGNVKDAGAAILHMLND